jgi:predicted ATP-grasp superfamily ATP-dependent carboligase
MFSPELYQYFTRYNLHRRMQPLTRKLILIGASVRAAALSVVRAGFQPYAIDLFADRDLAGLGPAQRIVRYPAEFFPALEAAPAAPWIYTGGLENYPRLIERLARMRPLLGNRGDMLRNVRDPAQIMQVARDAGCAFPATILGSAAVAEIGEQRQAVPSQWLVKPLRSSGGVAIRIASAEDLKYVPRGVYLQRQIDGHSLSAVFVAAGGKARLLGTTKQLVGRDFGLSRPCLYVGSVGPIVLNKADRARIQSLGELLAVRFGLVGLFNVDFVRNEVGLWPLEINPRYSASVEVLERSCECSLITLHVHACETERLPDAVPMKIGPCAGKAVVYAPNNGFVPEAMDDLVNDWSTSTGKPGIADLPQIGDQIRRDQPVVTVFADGDSPDQVEAELIWRVETIRRLIADS